MPRAIMGQAIAEPDLTGIPEYVRVSAAWLRRPHDCTLHGIINRCHGRCCYGPTYWPGKAGMRPLHACHWLGTAGCTLGAARPITCLLYPARINARGALVLHHRATMKTSCCKGNHGCGPMLVDAIAEGLRVVFGETNAALIRERVVAGRDVHVMLPHASRVALAQERRWEAANEVPAPRLAPD